MNSHAGDGAGPAELRAAGAAPWVMFRFDGIPVSGIQGEPLAFALFRAGHAVLGRTLRRALPRGLFCGAGHCFECRVTVDGQRNRRACLVGVRPGLDVRSEGGMAAVLSGGLQPLRAEASSPAESVDLAVVGAGPAGLAGAAAAARPGARVAILDERPGPGGRLPSLMHPHPRQPPQNWWRGAGLAGELVAEARSTGVRLRPETAVWGLVPHAGRWLVLADGPEGCLGVSASRVLVATGAAETPPPLPGWTLPGVVTAGACQSLVTGHGIRAARRALVVGVNPLGMAAACHLDLAGVEVVGVCHPPRTAFTGRLGWPGLALADLVRSGSRLVLSWPLRPLASLLALVQAAGAQAGWATWLTPRVAVGGARLLADRAAVRLEGDSRVREAWLAPVTPNGRVVGPPERVEVDLVVLAGRVSPVADLVEQAGCAFTAVGPSGDRLPLVGPGQETSAPGLYVAGSAAGVGSALVAVAQGRLAGFAVAASLGHLAPRAARAAMAAARRELNAAWRRTDLGIAPGVYRAGRVMPRQWRKYGASEQVTPDG